MDIIDRELSKSTSASISDGSRQHHQRGQIIIVDEVQQLEMQRRQRNINDFENADSSSDDNDSDFDFDMESLAEGTSNLKKDMETINRQCEEDQLGDNNGEFNLRYILILVKK